MKPNLMIKGIYELAEFLLVYINYKDSLPMQRRGPDLRIKTRCHQNARKDMRTENEDNSVLFKIIFGPRSIKFQATHQISPTIENKTFKQKCVQILGLFYLKSC